MKYQYLIFLLLMLVRCSPNSSSKNSSSVEAKALLQKSGGEKASVATQDVITPSVALIPGLIPSTSIPVTTENSIEDFTEALSTSPVVVTSSPSVSNEPAVGEIFSAIRNGDNATLSSLLTSDTTGVIAASVASVGKYSVAPTILGQNTSVYLYGNYLATRYPVQATGLAMLDTLNAALENVISTAIKGTATPTSLTFTHDPITHQILSFVYVGPGGGGTQTGTISPAIGNLIYLQNLGIAHCRLSGGIPAEIGNLTQLGLGTNSNGYPNQLSLLNAGLTGVIPSQIGNLVNLQFLTINGMGITGSLPESLANLTNLALLDLSDNQFNGPFPSWISQLTQLSVLLMSHNAFTGSLPSNIGDLSGLNDFEISENRLTGVIPESIGNIGSQGGQSFLSLDLGFNQFSGTIPASIWNLASYSTMKLLILSGNCLIGPVPVNPTPSAPGSAVVAEGISYGESIRGSSCAPLSITNTATSTASQTNSDVTLELADTATGTSTGTTTQSSTMSASSTQTSTAR